MKPRYLLAMALVALLAGCARPTYRQAARVDVCDPTITNPYLVKECAAKTGMDPADLQKVADQRIAAAQRAAMLQDDAANRAAADCNYQAKMANANNMGSGGIIGGLTAGILAGSACQDYYRNIGVIR